MRTLLSVIEEPCYALGLASILHQQSACDLVTIDNASTFEEAGERLATRIPDILVLDTTIQSAEAALPAFLTVEARSANVLALGTARSKAAVQDLFAAGVKGYLLKNASAPEFVKAVAAVSRGEGYLDASLVTALMRDDAARETRLARMSSRIGRISEREVAVLKRTAFGYSAKEIARALDISQKSVETYKARATAKLGLGSRSDIIRFANSSGWFSAFVEESFA